MEKLVNIHCGFMQGYQSTSIYPVLQFSNPILMEKSPHIWNFLLLKYTWASETSDTFKNSKNTYAYRIFFHGIQNIPCTPTTLGSWIQSCGHKYCNTVTHIFSFSFFLFLARASRFFGLKAWVCTVCHWHDICKAEWQGIHMSDSREYLSEPEYTLILDLPTSLQFPSATGKLKRVGLVGRRINGAN